MKTRRVSVFILCLSFTNILCADKNEIIKISKSEIPIALKVKGDFIDGVKFSDREGIHYVIISGSTKGEQFNKGWSSEFFAFKVTVKKDSVIKNWEIKDFSSDDFSELKFISNSLRVFDLDSNGVYETRFLYQILKGGDPFIVKYMLHYGNEKYAIRGIVPIGFDDSTDCETHLDSAYNNLTETIRNVARKDWDSVMTESFSCFTVQNKQ